MTLTRDLKYKLIDINSQLDTIITAILQHTSRDIITESLNQLCPHILMKLENYRTNINMKNKSTAPGELEEINDKFEKLILMIKDDFLQYKINDWIMVLAKNHQSPLTVPEINRLCSDLSGYDENSIKKINNAALTIQRQSRNLSRYELHTKIFEEDPKTHSTQTDVIDRFLNSSGLNPNLFKQIYYQLVSNSSIIHNKVYHWTTWDNLENILKNKAFFGNKILKSHNIKFKKNALDKIDINNGDEAVICLCPWFIDWSACSNGPGSISVRDQLIRLTLDLNQLDKSASKYVYNQFFKIFDFNAPPFISEVEITDLLSIRFEKKNYSTLSVTFIFNNIFYTFPIYKNEAIFYGNLYSINQFCINKLLELMDKLCINYNTSFKPQFCSYLLQLTESEIKKIFIAFCQHMTVFSEYNFNCVLSLTDYLITEIYDVHKNKLINLENFTLKDYEHLYFDILNKKNVSDTNFPQNENHNPIHNQFKFFFTKANHLLFYTINHHIKSDLTLVPNQIFDAPAYIETRDGCAALLAKQRKQCRMENNHVVEPNKPQTRNL